MHARSTDLHWETKLLSIVLLVASLTWSCSSATSADYHELFKEYFVPAENDLVKTDAGAAAQRLNEQAFRLYDQQRYDQALILFDELLKGQKTPDLLFFKGNTLLTLGQYQAALEIFLQVPEDHQRFSDSQWYAGLASLRMDRITQAKVHLSQVASAEEGKFRTKARQLLGRLN